MYNDNKAQALEIYNSSDKSTITNIYPTATVIDLFATSCVKAPETAVKISKKYMLVMGCSISYISAWCLQIDLATDSYFGRFSWCWAVLSIHLNDYTAESVSKGLFKSLKNKPAGNNFLAEKVLSIGSGSVTIYVILRDAESSNRTSKVVSLERGYQQEEVDTKIFLGVSDCLNNGYKVVVKMLDTDIITLLLAHFIRFYRLCDIMIDFGFGGNFCFFDISSGAPNIPDSPFHGMIFFCLFTGYEVLSSFFNLSKLGW